jgi:ferredoxin
MLKINLDKCMLCGGCVPVCSLKLIDCNITTLEIKLDDCTECGECIKVCPVGALDIKNNKG